MTNDQIVLAAKDSVDTVAVNIEAVKTTSTKIFDIQQVVLNMSSISDAYKNALDSSASKTECATSAAFCTSAVKAAGNAVKIAADIKAMKAEATPVPAGGAATAFYNASTGTMTIGVPSGLKGDVGPAGPAGAAPAIDVINCGNASTVALVTIECGGA